MAALAAEQAVKQPLKAAVRRPGHRETRDRSSPNTFTPLSWIVPGGNRSPSVRIMARLRLIFSAPHQPATAHPAL